MTKPLRTFLLTFSRVSLYATVKAASVKEARIIAEDFERRGELGDGGLWLLPEGRELNAEAAPADGGRFISKILILEEGKK